MGIAQKVSRQFTEGVRARGQLYFSKGKVTITSAKPGEVVVAKVRGTETYRVRLRVRAGRLYSSCTCLYFGPSGEPCKHIWATILAADARVLLHAAPVRPLRYVPDVRAYLAANPAIHDESGGPGPRPDADSGMETDFTRQPPEPDGYRGTPTPPYGPRSQGSGSPYPYPYSSPYGEDPDNNTRPPADRPEYPRPAYPTRPRGPSGRPPQRPAPYSQRPARPPAPGGYRERRSPYGQPPMNGPGPGPSGPRIPSGPGGPASGYHASPAPGYGPGPGYGSGHGNGNGNARGPGGHDDH